MVVWGIRRMWTTACTTLLMVKLFADMSLVGRRGVEFCRGWLVEMTGSFLMRWNVTHDHVNRPHDKNAESSLML
jgi:hypothetical protein